MRNKLKLSGFRVRHSGATLTEFAIVTPVVLMVGMGTVQAGLIYHGKSTLNYATFEAARTGAVNNAQLSEIRKELGMRLAPLEGGDGTAQSALIAIAKSSAAVRDPLSTRIKVLNPTTAAFDDWGVNSTEINGRVLPNSHLRHQSHTIGANSGLSLRDANLLKIEVTHGLDLDVPIVGALISKLMIEVDPENAIFYARKQLPIRAVATVRMQSEAWEAEIVTANLSPVVSQADATDSSGSVSQSTVTDGVTGQGESDEDPGSSCFGGEHGLGTSPVLIDTAEYDPDACGASSPVFGDIGGELEGSEAC